MASSPSSGIANPRGGGLDAPAPLTPHPLPAARSRPARPSFLSILLLSFGLLAFEGPPAIAGPATTAASSKTVAPFRAPTGVPQTGLGYRGDGTGIHPDSAPPTTWDETTGKNIRWKVAMPNFSSSGPVPVGNRVLAMNDRGWPNLFPQLHCYDTDTGALVWTTEIDPLEAFPELTPEQRKSLRDDVAFCLERLHVTYRANNDFLLAGGPTKARSSPDFLQQSAKDFEKAGYLVLDTDSLLFPLWGLRRFKQVPDLAKRENEAMQRLAVYGIQGRVVICACGSSEFLATAAPTPVSDGRFAFVITTHGTVACLDITDGKRIWTRRAKSLNKDAVKWLLCSPRLYGDILLTCFGGLSNSGRLIAWNKQTGEELWNVPINMLIGNEGNLGGDMAILHLTATKDPTAPKTPVVVTPHGMVVRLLNGKIYKTRLEPVSVYSGWGIDSEHGFICSSTLKPAVPAWFGSTLSVDGDDLIVTDRFRFKDTAVGLPTGAPVLANGRIYCSQFQFDANTGQPVGTGFPPKNAPAKGHNSPFTQHSVLLAGGHLYGLQARIGKDLTSWGRGDGTCEVFTMDGTKISSTALRMAPYTGDKLIQMNSQFWLPQGEPHGRFSVTCPMSISGKSLYIRSNDYLYCIAQGKD